jgi:AcrR family transcriptional regulator
MARRGSHAVPAPRDLPVAVLTRMRILDAALRLFNASGVAQTSTNRIAAEVEISPGNLYYHFKNKSQIVERLFGRFELELEPLRLAYQDVRAIDDVWLMLHLVIEVLQRYRFAYRDIDYLMREFPAVQLRAIVVTKVTLRSARDLCLRLAELRVIRASAEEAEVLAFHIVMALTCWPTFARLLPHEHEAQPPVGQAAYHVLTLLMPYVGTHERGYLDYLRTKYADGLARVAPRSEAST